MVKEAEQHAEEANRLYWNKEASVGEIAARLGISRRALYDVLEPLPAGVPCEECGTDTVFVNRSALASGVARCPSCEAETAVPAAREERQPQTVPAAAPPAVRNGRLATPVALGTVALAGVVVGAIATLLVTRRA